MNWCFAIVNNKLAEIYFEKDKGRIKFQGHCYIQKSEFKTKREQKWIEKDTAKLKLVYRSGQYSKVILPTI